MEMKQINSPDYKKLNNEMKNETAFKSTNFSFKNIELNKKD
jgi:hypothetical protein